MMDVESTGRSRKRAAGVIAALVVLSAAGAVDACPRCETGIEARQAAWGDQPGTWLLVAVAPFAVMLALGAATYRIGHPGRRPRRDHLPKETGAS